MRRRRTPLAAEVLGAGLIAVLVAAAMTWPAALHPASTVPSDLGDPLLQAWQLGWDGHALRSQPLHIFDSNTFWPLRNSLAFSDSLLGYAPAGLIGAGTSAALARYNVLYVFAFAFASVGAYALARQLGTGRLAAAACGAAYAYAPWRIAQAGHLHILSSGGIPLALALLARGHGIGRSGAGPRRRERAGWALAGWAVAAWQLTIGFGLGLPFAYLLGLVVATAAVWVLAGGRRPSRRLLLADTAGVVGFLAVGLLLSLPYLRVAAEHPEARRDAATVALFSPPWRGFVTAPEQSRIWGSPTAGLRASLPFPPEMTQAPGLTVLVAGLAGLVAGTWSRRRRLALGATVVVGVVLASGTTFPGGGRASYLLLLEHAPGWAGIRTPGRLMVFVTLALGLLAATGLDALRRRGRLLRAAAVALVLAEGASTLAHPRPDPRPAALDAPAPLLVLPAGGLLDETVMFWTTVGFPPVVNGTSGFTPRAQERLYAGSVGFPDAASVALLRRAGVRSVVVLRDRLAGTPWQGAADRSVGGLPLTRRDRGSTVVFTLAPR